MTISIKDGNKNWVTTKSGLQVVFDGIDASGKTYMMNQYMERMKAEGFNVKSFKAIGEGEVGSSLRNLLLNFKEHRMNPISEKLLFIAAIYECYHNHILPWINQGGIAVLDRYVYSTHAYQYQYLSEYIKYCSPFTYDQVSNMIEDSDKLLISIPAPHITVLCQVNKDTAIQNKTERDGNDSMDKFCFDNIDKMIERYKEDELQAFFDSNHLFVTINNDRPYPSPTLETELDKLVQLSKIKFQELNS